MRVVFYSAVLNHHQAHVADEFYRLLGDKYCFVELSNNADLKGGSINYSQRPYLLRSWESEQYRNQALRYAKESEICVFAGVDALPFMKCRLKENKLSFLMSERWLKKGILNLASPAILKMFLTYHLNGYSHKRLYALCCSAYSSYDYNILRMFNKKSYKWGYFVNSLQLEKIDKNDSCIRLMWCARFISLKKPELPILMAAKLKEQGYTFRLDMFGTGPLLEESQAMVMELGLQDVINFPGFRTNEEIRSEMCSHDIFLFTSDKNEGWGVVLNESMGSGCCVVASDAIGSVPYLIKHKETGMIYRSGELGDLVQKVKYLIDNPSQRRNIAQKGHQQILNVWSPMNAVSNFMRLIDDLRKEKSSSIVDGPCSIA